MSDKTLPERMREAADVLEDSTNRQFGEGTRRPTADKGEWSARALREYANRFEREDAEQAALDAEVEELARTMHAHNPAYGSGWQCTSDQARDYNRRLARDLIAAGWRKVAS